MEVALLVVAVVFAVATGINDGAALLAVALGVRGVVPVVAALLLAASVALVPLVVGTRVAGTLAGRLVTFDGAEGRIALLVAVLVAMALPTVLAWWRLPTSITLALVGAIAGAGWGSGAPVSWSTVLTVLALAAVAPAVGAAIAWVLTRTVAAIPSRAPLARRVRRWHRCGVAALCVAYGANDGQKILAVLAVATGVAAGGAVPTVPWQLAVAAGGFLVGTVIGLPRVASALRRGVATVHPPAAVVTEVAAAAAVLGAGALAAPVSMTQATSGAVVGTAVTHGRGRVRWRQAGRLAVAWGATLPASVVLAAAVAAAATAST